MIRKIVEIDQGKCNGCGLCVNACHEGALQMVNGKAQLVSDSYCDGLGDCLPECPVDAIRIVERQAEIYQQELVDQKKKENQIQAVEKEEIVHGCPGMRAATIRRQSPQTDGQAEPHQCVKSELGQWPVQIKLVSPIAPYFNNASILVAADCTAYAYAGFHQDFMRGKITLIGCPKLDQTDYSEKLAEILRQNKIRDITVVRMEVPCCGGMTNAVKKAIAESGNIVPWKVVVVGTDGTLIEE